MRGFAANLSMLFTEQPFLDRFALAAQHGFAAVEFWLPYDWPAAQVAQRLRDAGLQCACINAPPGEMQGGHAGLAADPGRVDLFKASIHRAYEYASELGCPQVHVMAGASRSPKPGSPAVEPAQHGTYLANLAFAAEHAATLGKRVLIEPLNPVDRPGYLLSRQQQARDVVAAVGAPNLRVMFDLYHVQMTEGRLIDNLRLHIEAGTLGHIQMADVPGRHEPGTGEVNWGAVFAAISASGYDGWVGCEYKPVSTTAGGLAWRQAAWAAALAGPARTAVRPSV